MSMTNTDKKPVKENLKKEWQDKMDGHYYEAVGRRKTATARVRLFEADKDEIIVNGQPAREYFSTEWYDQTVRQALNVADLDTKFFVSVHVAGSGLHAQAEAIRHGISRCLIEFNPEIKSSLKEYDLLKRDPRMKERKKPGRKKARKSEQWSKR